MTSRIERNIVKEIMRESLHKNLHTNENFVMFIVQLLLLDPNWDITENLLHGRTNVQNLVKHVIRKLEVKDSISMITLKMQFYFMWCMDHMQDVVTNNRNILLNRLHPIKAQICLTKPPETVNEKETLRKLIVVYTVFLSGLANPMKNEVFLEGVSALRSLVNDDELQKFCGYSKELKEVELEVISKLICGIRLFNKYSERGGAGIPDLPELFRAAVIAVKDEMSNDLDRIVQKANMLTKIFQKYYILRKSTQTYFLENIFPSFVDRKLIEDSKNLLIYYRQHELFVRKILECLQVLEDKVAQTEEEFQDIMEQIHKIVRSRMAVPIVTILPLFHRVSDLWTTLQHQVMFLSKYSSVVSKLDLYSKSLFFNRVFFDDLLHADQTMHSDHRLVEHTDCCICPYKQIEVVDMEIDESIELEYLGFCCWKLVETDGVLIPGCTDMGVAFYKGKYYAFSSQEAYGCFSKNPEEYIKHVITLTRRKPELINFLMLHDQLREVSRIKTLVKEKLTVKKTESSAVQTEEDYVVAPYKDNQYKWNIWDLKREVLLLCHLSTCKTISTQTVKSHSVNSIELQTETLKEQSTQTRTDKYTSVPTPSRFICGLRGRKDDRQFEIDLTRPVEE